MKLPTALLPAFAVTSLLPAALVYDLNFEGDTLGALAAGDTLGGGGAIVGAGSSIADAGFVSTFCGTIEMGQVLDVADDSWFNTMVDFDSMLGSTGSSTTTPYTMAAWLNFPSVGGGDRMVFGSGPGGGQRLHLGTRNDNYHSGHWGDDLQNLGTPSSTIGTWSYVVWTNDGSGTQEIFVDGVSQGSGAGGTPARTFGDLVIGGTRNDTGRDYIGQIGGIQVHSGVLSPAQQKSIALSVAVPEPSRAILLVIALAGLALRRRR